MQFLYKAFKPLILSLDAERSHNLAIAYLKKNGSTTGSYTNRALLSQDIFGTTLMNPLGLAAGFDKYAEIFHTLPGLSFSFAELGSFTKTEQLGNPKPRIKRIRNEKAVINRMGFNNPGIDKGLTNVGELIPELDNHFQYSISIGKSKETPPEQALGDYEEMLRKLNSSALAPAYVAINISSPNTPGLRALQTEGMLKELLQGVMTLCKFPLLVKLAPDFETLDEFRSVVAVCADQKVDGIIVTNTTTDHGLLKKNPDFAGGLSGLPLRSKARMYLREAYTIVKEEIPLIASGGVMTPEDIWDRLLLGARLVQVYTGMIYYGPNLAIDGNRHVAEKLREWGLKDLPQLFAERSSLKQRELL